MHKASLIIILMFVFVKNSHNFNLSETNNFHIIKEKNVILYENIVGTVYHPEKNQTDDTPLITADNSKIDNLKINKLRWIALSRDLLNTHDKWRNWNGKISFGDTIIVESPKNSKGEYLYPEINGEWIVHDTMNKRYFNRIDFLQSKNGIYGKWENLIIKKKIIEKQILKFNLDIN